MRESVRRWMLAIEMRSWVLHSARTAVAAALAFGIARLVGLPEAYWAPISTLIVMQSTLGAAWAVSKDRLLGTVVGSAFGAALAAHAAPRSVSFVAGIFVLGLLCAVLRFSLAAYRFAGVTFAIVMLVTREQAAWLVGLHRLSEVSLGIVVGLATTAAWPGDMTSAGRRRPTGAFGLLRRAE